MDFNFSAYKDYGEHPLKQLIEEEDLLYKGDLGPDNEIVKIGETFKELFMEHDRYNTNTNNLMYFWLFKTGDVMV